MFIFKVVVVEVKLYLFSVKSGAKRLCAAEQSYTIRIYTHIHITITIQMI